jgi:DNA-directed RNA polymerase specialized sigma24 family protein
MKKSHERTPVDEAVSRLIQLTPYTDDIRPQDDWNLVRQFLRRRFSIHSIANIYDDADLFHECLIRALSSRHTWNGAGPLRGWFFVIAKNSLRSTLRRKARELFISYEDEQPSEQADDTPVEIDARESASARIAHFREWIKDTQDTRLLEFLDALIADMQGLSTRNRLKFVMGRLSLASRTEYNALYSRLKRASATYATCN